jgi:hypothetical protein
MSGRTVTTVTTVPKRGRHDHRRPPGPARTGTAPSSVPPHAFFATRLLDVLTGRRPITCLAGHVPAAMYDRLWELLSARGDWREMVRGHIPHVKRCLYSLTHDDALEVTAVVTLAPDRIRAIAFRLERGTDGWRCTAAEAH